MAVVPYQPQNLVAEQANGNILLSWSASLGATSYQVQRSTDGVNFTNLSTTTYAVTYIDALPGVGIMFYYQVAAVNSTGTSPYSSIAQMVAAPPAEMSLYEVRLRSKQTADREKSDFVSDSEWNSMIRVAEYELYDLIITAYEDYFSGDNIYIQTNGTLQKYPFPNGVDNYLGGTFPNTAGGVPARAFYKLVGMDLGVNTSNNAWVTLKRYDFIMRNAYVYPNSTSTIYGVYNMRYRPMADSIELIPTPAGNQQIRMRYAPRLQGLLADNDITSISYSGWVRYIIVRAAKYALNKEEGDTSALDAELVFLKQRIMDTVANRDIGQADTISETRQDSLFGTNWGGGSQAGW